MTNNPHDVPRLVRAGRRPNDVKDRLQLAVEQLSGDVPFNVDAPNKTNRKATGGAASLLFMLRYSFIGLIAVFFGGLFVWAGCYGQFDIKVVAIGVIGLAVGVFFLALARRHWERLKAIAEA